MSLCLHRQPTPWSNLPSSLLTSDGLVPVCVRHRTAPRPRLTQRVGSAAPALPPAVHGRPVLPAPPPPTPAWTWGPVRVACGPPPQASPLRPPCTPSRLCTRPLQQRRWGQRHRCAQVQVSFCCTPCPALLPQPASTQPTNPLHASSRPSRLARDWPSHAPYVVRNPISFERHIVLGG